MSIRVCNFLPIAALLLASPLAAQKGPRQPLVLKLAPIGAPVGVTASYTRMGVQLNWQGVANAAQYQIHRGPDANTMGQLVVLPADQLSWLDQGFNSNAAYRVVAVSAQGASGASDPVLYAAPARLIAPTALKGGRAGLTTMNPPVITSLAQPPAGAEFARNGDNVVVTGTGLDGISSVGLLEVYNYKGGFKAGGGFDPAGWYPVNSTSTPLRPVAPANITPTRFTMVPQVPVPGDLRQNTSYLVVVTKGTMVDTSNTPIFIAGALPVRKLTAVAEKLIRSGLRFDITGQGLNDVIGGYFGTGLPGSVTNPMFNIANRGPNGVQLMTTATCDQEGMLELAQNGYPGESNSILPTPRITVACVPETPSGTVMGSNAGSYVSVAPGSQITILGKYLKYVTRVLTSTQTPLPFTYSKVGSTERLNVTLPSQSQAGAMSFMLDNPLTNPVVMGTVSGGVTFTMPATFNGISPAWAEAGQLVRVTGHNIKYSAPVQVTVGGVPATVTAASALDVTFRLGAGTTAGPIVITNEAGPVTMSGPFPIYGGQHPGFFVVSGPSSVTQLVIPPGLAAGGTITVQGQNLARLGGICVASTGQGGAPQGWLTLQRADMNGLNVIASNTTMQVTVNWPAASIAAGPVQLYAPTQPPGDYMITTFACAPNSGGANWP